ncbi:ATP-binding protein [Desulfonatronospira sp.]|uniref:ATP-binding protein n=1 Tax=Desulfonatronospira sp. TaxID=1962951 RepID=UPI0025BF90AC|nr:ATP-binding protein [Desulfonatronospira sp.]
MRQPDSGDFSWLQLSATRENLPIFQEFVINEAKRIKTSAEILQKVELVLEETLLNIICYAYPHNHEGSIQLGCCLPGPGELYIRIVDSGIAFDPLSRPDPDVGQPMQDREVGGLGIHLVRRMADRVEYQRKDEMNILDIVFRT